MPLMKIDDFIEALNLDMHCKEVSPKHSETGKRYLCTVLVNHARMVTFDLERPGTDERPTIQLVLRLLKVRALFAEIFEEMQKSFEIDSLKLLESERGFSYPVCAEIRDSLVKLLGNRRFDELMYDVVQ